MTVSRAARRAAALWAMVLGAVLAIELAVAALPAPRPLIDQGVRFYPPTRPPSVDETLIHWQIDRLWRTPADVVLFGDSSALMGLDPAVFAQVTGRSTQNFGTVRWLATEGHADILELYVERHGPPLAAVYQMGTGLHGLGATSITSNDSDRGRLLGAFRAWVGRTEQPPIPLPSLALRPSARAAADGTAYHPAYTHAPRAFATSDAEMAAYLRDHDGRGIDVNPRPADSWADAPGVAVNFDPDIEPGIDRMFRLADDHGFPLLVVHNPIPAEFRDQDRSAAYQLVERRLVALAEPYAGVQVLGPFDRYVPNEFFANYEHLTPEGAVRHSGQVAGLVARMLPPAP